MLHIDFTRAHPRTARARHTPGALCSPSTFCPTGSALSLFQGGFITPAISSSRKPTPGSPAWDRGTKPPLADTGHSPAVLEPEAFLRPK